MLVLLLVSLHAVLPGCSRLEVGINMVGVGDVGMLQKRMPLTFPVKMVAMLCCCLFCGLACCCAFAG